MPSLGAIPLALMFGAGMPLTGAADGVFMSIAYGWTLSTPLREIYYNLTTTGRSVAAALLVGTIEIPQVMAIQLKLHGEFFNWLAGADAKTRTPPRG
ncbi:MAG: hypothetical protein ACREQI_13105 [Candidatus Binataceae bacterium]